MNVPANKLFISANNLTIAYNDDVIFRNEEFRLEGPGLVLIIGPNGAGKTTLFKTMLGLIKPVSGKIIANGVNITGKPEVAGKIIGYVPQILELNTVFPINVREVVESAVILRQRIPRLITPRETRERVSRVLSKLGLEGIADKPLVSLSGGQRQRAFIARALVWDPKILIMDEPLSAVDPKGRSEIAELIVSLSHDHLVLVSSHDPGFFLPYASMVLVVNRGIIAMGSPGDVMRLDVLKKVYGGSVMLIDKCVHVVDSHVR